MSVFPHLLLVAHKPIYLGDPGKNQSKVVFANGCAANSPFKQAARA
jgi:hypothetical protein